MTKSIADSTATATATARAATEYALADERYQAGDVAGRARALARARYWARRAEALAAAAATAD